MKQTITILFSVLAFSAFAQTKGSGKLYGYKQAAPPGMVRKTLDENGAEKAAPVKQNENYYLYLVTSSRAYPSELWIKGEPFGVRLQTIEETPVEQANTNVRVSTAKKILVPKTTQKVVQLIPAPMEGKSSSAKAKSLASANELVVLYKQNGKFYFQTVKKLTELEAMALQ